MSRIFNAFTLSLIFLFVSWAYNTESTVVTEVEIAAHPGEVRKVLLDWPTWKEWHSSMIQRIETADGKPAKNLKVGDAINADIGAARDFTATVLKNDAQEFRWYGSAVAGAFAGEHYFLFEDSKATQGGTRLVHGETYLGWMKWIFVLPGMNGYAHDLFNGLTVDLKTRVEGLKAEGRL